MRRGNWATFARGPRLLVLVAILLSYLPPAADVDAAQVVAGVRPVSATAAPIARRDDGMCSEMTIGGGTVVRASSSAASDGEADVDLALPPLPPTVEVTIAGQPFDRFTTDYFEVNFQPDVPTSAVQRYWRDFEAAAARIGATINRPANDELVSIYVFCTLDDLATGASALRGERVDGSSRSGSASAPLSTGVTVVGGSVTVSSSSSSMSPWFTFASGRNPGIYLSANELYLRLFEDAAPVFYAAQLVDRLANRASGGVDALPAWFRRGLANNLRLAAIADQTYGDAASIFASRLRNLAHGHAKEVTLPLAELAKSADFARRTETQRRVDDWEPALTYTAEASMAVVKLLERSDWPRLFALFTDVVAGASWEARFVETFGESVEAFDAAFLAWIPEALPTVTPTSARLTDRFAWIVAGFRRNEGYETWYEYGDGARSTPVKSRGSADTIGVAMGLVSSSPSLEYGDHQFHVDGARGSTATLPFRVVADGEASVEPRLNAEGGPSNLLLLYRAFDATTSIFYRPIDASLVFNGAVRAANEELQRQDLPPSFASWEYPADVAGNWPPFARAYTQVVDAARATPTFDEAALTRAILRGIAFALRDCHTSYVSAERHRAALREPSAAGKSRGVGLLLRLGVAGYPVIREVYAESPAERAGLRLGDVIVEIGGQDAKAIGIGGIAGLTRDSFGKPLQVIYTRLGGARQTATMTPSEYPTPTYTHRVLDGNVGYLRVVSFAGALDPAALAKLWSQWQRARVRQVVIDLRGNPGGTSRGVVTLASAFTPKGALLFSATNRQGEVTRYTSTGSRWARPPKVALLTDEDSASAAELTSVALQEHGVARLFGEKTAGCFNAAFRYGLGDGSALAIASYHGRSPLGNNFERVGVKPDTLVAQSMADFARGVDHQLAAAQAWLAATAAEAPTDEATAFDPDDATLDLAARPIDRAGASPEPRLVDLTEGIVIGDRAAARQAWLDQTIAPPGREPIAP